MTLLRTIGNHPQAAHFLAELAGGAEPAELVRSFFPELFTGSGTDSDDKETENTAEQETAMFRSRMDHPQPEASCPTFLAHMRKGFWD